MLNSQLGSRSAFRECQILGTTVHFIPRAGAAIKVDSMTDEVLRYSNLVNAKNWGKLRWLQNLIEKELMRASLGNERKKVEDRFAAAGAVHCSTTRFGRGDRLKG
jgi:hypothetical protein